jgi:alkaline phosphatase D
MPRRATFTKLANVITRRKFIGAVGVSALGVAISPTLVRAALFPRSRGYPFSLGVASGYPSASGMVLWTRLAPEPLAPGGGVEPKVVPVRYEIARDERFRDVVVEDTAYATPEWSHSVHVEARGLEADRWYWYRFHTEDATSAVGRTRTTPAADASVDRLRFAVASCQQFEQGWYSAYRHMLDDSLDLVVHVGDYVYESSWGANHVRKHEAGEPVTLDDYRIRFARYRSDPDLQSAHAHCPWVSIWDDHEVENDHANDRSENDDDKDWFLARRAAAYKAYYEHMPMPRSMLPFGPAMPIHTRLAYGQLASINLLDDRQYRSYQPCPRAGRGGGAFIEDCKERLDPSATMLGTKQEKWLEAGLDASTSRWNLLAQQTLMAQADALAGPGERFYSDGWDGYPAARKRLLDFLGKRKPANPVVLSGDVHSFWVNDLKPDFANAKSPIVASELVGTSISSQPPPEERIQTAKSEGPHIHFANGAHRGYLRVELTPQRLTVDLRALDDATDRKTACNTLASFVIEDGKPGPQPA